MEMPMVRSFKATGAPRTPEEIPWNLESNQLHNLS